MRFKHILKAQIGLIVVFIGIFLFGAGLYRGFKGGDQDIITFFLLFISFFLPIMCCINRREKDSEYGYDFFQPGIIMVIFFYIYIVTPAIHIWYNLNYNSNWISIPSDKQAALFNYTLLITNMGIMCFGLGYRAKIGYIFNSTKSRRLSNSLKRIRWSNDSFIKLIIVVLIGIGLLARIFIISKIWGLLSDILGYLSPSIRATRDIKISGIIYFLSSFLDWGALFLFLRYIVTKKKGYLAILVMLFALVSGYLLGGKRSDVLPFFLFPLVWYHYLRRRINFSLGLVYALGGLVFMASLMFARSLIAYSFIDPASVKEVISEIKQDPLDVYLNSPELTVFDMTVASIKDRENILENIGGWFSGMWNYNFSTILYLIPRILWIEKPVFEDLGQIMYRLFIGDSKYVGFSLGIFGGLYIFGGLIGVLIGMIAIGVMCRAVYLILQPYKSTSASVFIYSILIWIIFMFFRFGTLGFTILFFIQKLSIGTTVGLLWLFLQKRSVLHIYKNRLVKSD